MYLSTVSQLNRTGELQPNRNINASFDWLQATGLGWAYNEGAYLVFAVVGCRGDYWRKADKYNWLLIDFKNRKTKQSFFLRTFIT